MVVGEFDCRIAQWLLIIEKLEFSLVRVIAYILVSTVMADVPANSGQ
jgi:hypothetical protein